MLPQCPHSWDLLNTAASRSSSAVNLLSLKPLRDDDFATAVNTPWNCFPMTETSNNLHNYWMRLWKTERKSSFVSKPILSLKCIFCSNIVHLLPSFFLQIISGGLMYHFYQLEWILMLHISMVKLLICSTTKFAVS